MRVNSGTLYIGAIDLLVLYNASLLTVVSAVNGTSWSSGSFVATLNNPPGEISFGGTPTIITGTTLQITASVFTVNNDSYRNY